jgi:hypothetical protein
MTRLQELPLQDAKLVECLLRVEWVLMEYATRTMFSRFAQFDFQGILCNNVRGVNHSG